MTEHVDHPAHYGGADNIYETIKVIRAWGLGFAIGNVVKYLSRAGKKGGETLLRDLKKARWYLDNEIQQLEPRGEHEPPTKAEQTLARVFAWRDSHAGKKYAYFTDLDVIIGYSEKSR